tara:strand:+ start:295 stop:510 length:216 start_codon:yes stop_codon:yes gene_type:complete
MATDKNFVVKNGLTIGSTEVINSSGVVASSALSNVGTALTVIGRSANTSVTISNATLTVVGRSANVSVGVS